MFYILAYPDVLGAAQPRPAWEVFAHLVEAISPPSANLAYLNAPAAVSTTNRASHAKNAWQRVMVGGTRLFRPRWVRREKKWKRTVQSCIAVDFRVEGTSKAQIFNSLKSARDVAWQAGNINSSDTAMDIRLHTIAIL